MAGKTPAALSNLERGLLLWKNANIAYAKSAGGYKWRYAVEDNNDREVV